MAETVADLLRTVATFHKVGPADRARLAAASTLRLFARGEAVFHEGAQPEHFCVLATGRVKVFTTTAAGKDVILEIFGPGDLLGAVAVYEGRPYPASAVALEETACVLTPRGVFFQLLEQHPSLVRGLLLGLTQRLVELTHRVAELSGGRIEGRLARLFLKLAADVGRPQAGDGIFVPMVLSRQELADLTGTTIETCIRIMSRWGKQGVVLTGKTGFTVRNRAALDTLARS